MKCYRGFELTVLHSAAGYYIGTEDFDGELRCVVPNCRISTRYYDTRDEALYDLTHRNFVVRRCSENDFCSLGRPCI
jgi:hypothetical protein